jgi:YHS domain-containing protein
MRGWLDHDGPLEGIERMSLQERINGWVIRGLASLMRKVLAGSVRTPGSAPGRRPQEPHSAVPLYRDPWCGTYISPEISFPLEQAGQVLHFCSADCRTRYRGTSKRAASA